MPDDEYLCPKSADGLHFRNMTFVLSSGRAYRATCELCDERIKVKGHRWVTDRYLISEEELIEDLL